jgi:hypothetical protein
MKLAYEKLQNDFEKLKKEESDVSIRLQDLLYVCGFFSNQKNNYTLVKKGLNNQ